MSVTVKGLNEVLKDLEKRLGKKSVDRVSNQALKAGAKEFVKILKQEFEKFKDTGESIREIKIGEPENINGLRSIRVFWRGNKDRYRVIHLNEWGTVHNPKPRGKGAIARSMLKAEKAYKRAIEDAVRRGL